MSSEFPESINPRKWRFTWESHSHIPLLRLYLFNLDTKPSSQCTDLNVKLVPEQSLLTVCWFQLQSEVSLRVPVPSRVLIDVESPVNYRALDDHIEVKFVLLLPVDHPIVSNFDSEVLSQGNASPDQLKPLVMDSDLTKLSSGEEVHFYCRSCLTKLTRSLRFFEEMPSVNWREAADNWFGTCCCSFGGISEKLVANYAKSYTCVTGVCLLNDTSVILHKDDFVGCKFPDDGHQEYQFLDFPGGNCLQKSVLGSLSKDVREVCLGSQRLHNCCGKLNCFCPREDNFAPKLDSEISEEFQTLQLKEGVASDPKCCSDMKTNIEDHYIECCTHHASEPSSEEQKLGTTEHLPSQKSFLNGFVGNSFMARSSYLSKDIQWIEFLCPQCSCLLGAYPHHNADAVLYGNDATAPLDSGVHLFKCCISTCLDFAGSTDLFRKYTLERMFTSQLLESAKDELSFRTVIRDLQTKCPMLQIVLLNPNSWYSTGNSLAISEPIPNTDMYPTVKLLFSDCSNSTEFQLRLIEQWRKKNQVEEVYMLTSQIKELRESLVWANSTFPPSHATLQGLSLSSLRR